jgi:Meiotically up-regulated gene 113
VYFWKRSGENRWDFMETKIKTEPYGIVYFIGAAEAGPVKIGFTADRTAGSRLAQLQTGSHEALVVLGTVEAGPAVERAIHKVLNAHCIRGEWFERESALALCSRLNETASRHSGDFIRRLMRAADMYLVCDQVDGSIESKVASSLVFNIAHELQNVNTDKPLPFQSWLKGQVDRDDPTGDLAKDFANSATFPGVGNLETYLAFIEETEGNAAMIRAVMDAWIECDLAVVGLKYGE